LLSQNPKIDRLTTTLDYRLVPGIPGKTRVGVKPFWISLQQETMVAKVVSTRTPRRAQLHHSHINLFFTVQMAFLVLNQESKHLRH